MGNTKSVKLLTVPMLGALPSHFAHETSDNLGKMHSTAPWARETNIVKKPPSQMYESCRKLDLRFL